MKQGSNRSCFVLQLDLGMLRTITSSLDVFLFSRFFSLFLSPHPSNRVSFSRLKSFRSSPFRTPARASMVVHGRALVSFPIRSISCNCFELAPGFDLALFRSKVDDLDHRTTMSCLIFIKSTISFYYIKYFF